MAKKDLKKELQELYTVLRSECLVNNASKSLAQDPQLVARLPSYHLYASPS
jgi:hypothetical protein